MNPVFELNVERNISTVSVHSEADMVGKACLSMFFFIIGELEILYRTG